MTQPRTNNKDLIPVPHRRDSAIAPLQVLAQIPEEQIWLNNFTSKHTRETYRDSVIDFIESLGLRGPEDFRIIDRAAIIAWRDKLMKDGKTPRTVKTRMSALSSLFNHLVAHDAAEKNPVKEVEAPKLRVRRGETKALSSAQARKLLNIPPEDTLQGLRDRAILSVGLQVGPRREEISKLRLKDFHDEQGYPSLKLRRKGGSHGSVAIHQQCSQRIKDYLEKAGHGSDADGPLFRPIKKNQRADKPDRHLTPKQVDNIFKHWCKVANLPANYSSHSMRATCATQALNNGASIEQVQELLGHAHSSTTQLYDRRGYSPERSASFFATY